MGKGQAAASACGACRRSRVRDAEGAPKGRSRLAERGETEPREPRSSPTRAQRGARPQTNLALRFGMSLSRPGKGTASTLDGVLSALAVLL